MKKNNLKITESAFFFIGFSASGKTTLAKLFIEYLNKKQHSAFLFDGNEMSDYKILNKFNGFDIDSRYKRAKQLTNMVNWVKNQEIIPIVAVIGQPEKAREYWRKNVKGYFEIYLKCNLEICINRDNKGIYNDNSNIIGKDLDFQEPKQYDIMLNSEKYSPEELLNQLINKL